MLIHLTPRFYLQYSDVQVDLVDIEIPELGVTLKNNVDLMVRTPYPNKKYKVVCRKKGQKAIKGFLIETDKRLDDFTVIARWSVTVGGGEIKTVVSHTTHFHVIDSDYDAISEYQIIWSGFYNTPYASRLNEEQKKWIPAGDQPRMILLEKDDSEGARFNQRYNHINHDSLITERVEFYTVPTVERERLTTPFFGNDRFPSIDDAFQATVKNYPYTLKSDEFLHLGVFALSFPEFASSFFEEDIYDVSLLNVLDDLREEEFFFANTNDLVIKARMYSDTYDTLNDKDRECVDTILSQPIVLFSFEESQGETQQSAP